MEKLRDRIHVIAINESHKLCPWADILYSADGDWWSVRGPTDFAGIRLGFDLPRHGVKPIVVARRDDGWVNDFLFNQPGVVGSGGHSGFQMINLVAQFGVTGIGLVGFDMQRTHGVHWHADHPLPLRNPDAARLEEWRATLDGNAPTLAARGIDVVNCSHVSALTAFPKMSIDRMLQRWGL